MSTKVKTILGGLVLSAVLWLSPFSIFHVHKQKHTGPVIVQFRVANGKCIWFQRPNLEVFEACFDNPPLFGNGLVLADITYVDDNANWRHFLKATLGGAR